MNVKQFVREISESKESKKITYKCLSIHMLISLYYIMKAESGCIDPFMIPFRDYIKGKIDEQNVDVDDLIKYMIENDKSHCIVFLITSSLKRKKEMSELDYSNAIEKYKVSTPFVEKIDFDAIALIVISFVFDNLITRKVDIREIVGKEEFIYPTNQYGLTKINGAAFKKDGLIFDGKGYYYNFFTDKTMITPDDCMVGFARVIQDNTNSCDVLYRLDERLSMPESEYYDYTGESFAKFRGPHFEFNGSSLGGKKTIIVHYDENTMDKLLMVIKKGTDQNTKEEFWHIEIETLPYKESINTYDYVITTFLHGIYYPLREIFNHIDYTKNQYDIGTYQQKYADSQKDIQIDQYTETRDLHYKIWCIENGEFTKEVWYKLMIVSLSERYQKLLNEILT